MSKEMTLSRDQAEAFYAEHKDADFFETLVTNMTRFVKTVHRAKHSLIPLVSWTITLQVLVW